MSMGIPWQVQIMLFLGAESVALILGFLVYVILSDMTRAISRSGRNSIEG